MASETEELRLVVNLTDNASAGIAKLRNEISQLGGGQGGQGLERFNRETARITQNVKGLGVEAGMTARVLGSVLGAGVGVAAGAIGALGAAITYQIVTIPQWTSELRRMGDAARNIGANAGQFRSIVEQLGAVGVEAGAAEKSMAGINNAIADLTRRGSALRQELLRRAGPEGQAGMRAFIDSLMAAQTQAERTNRVIIAGENVYKNALKETGSELEARRREQEWLQRFGVDPSLAGKRVKEQTAEEKAAADERMKNAKAFSDQLGAIGLKMTTIFDMMKDPLIGPDSMLVKGMQLASDLLDKIIAGIKWYQGLKSVPVAPGTVPGDPTAGLFGGLVPQKQSYTDGGGFAGLVHKATYAPQGGPADGGAGGGAAPYGQTAGPGTGKGAGATPPMGEAAAGGASLAAVRGGQADELADPAVRNKLMAYAHAEVGSQGPQAVQAFMESTLNRAAARGKSIDETLSGSYFPGSTHSKAAGGAPAGARAGYDKMIDQVLGGSNISNLATGNASGKVGFGGGPQTFAAGGERFGVEGADRAWANKMRGDGGGAVPYGQTAGAGTGAAGSPESGDGQIGPQAALAIARQHLGEDEIRDQSKLQAWFDKKGIKVNPASTAWCAAFVNASLEGAGVKGTGSLAAGSFVKYGKGVSGEESAAGDIGVVRGRSSRTGVEGRHVGLLTGETRIGPNGQLQVQMIGGNQGGTVSGRGGVSEQWRDASSLHIRRPDYDTAIARRQMDRSQAAASKVEGTGKITVDVNAPKGTNVGAEGGGLFKDVEINRQTQMEPARTGPAAETYSL